MPSSLQVFIPLFDRHSDPHPGRARVYVSDFLQQDDSVAELLFSAPSSPNMAFLSKLSQLLG